MPDYKDLADTLYRALYDYLHALHPASQAVAADSARNALAQYERVVGK